MPKVQITDPRGELVIPQINTMPDDPTRFSVRYTPKEVGNHQVRKTLSAFNIYLQK